ncbi:MAG TPA: FAD-dependent oxidoreductase, partial [Chryseosolibacter sp.]
MVAYQKKRGDLFLTSLAANFNNHFQAIVLGAGSMGAAACYYLAKRGQKVLALEQFTTPHEKGSHAGQSRIIRKAYFEH